MAENIGKVIQVSGPAVDVQFEEATMPPIYQALRVTSEGFDVPSPINVVLEVEQHIGEGRVRCVAMESTEGMVRGMQAIDQGGPIAVGSPANLCVLDPQAKWTVDGLSLASKSHNTPFEGQEMTGRVRHTVFRGEPVVVDGRVFVVDCGRGSPSAAGDGAAGANSVVVCPEPTVVP